MSTTDTGKRLQQGVHYMLIHDRQDTHAVTSTYYVITIISLL